MVNSSNLRILHERFFSMIEDFDTFQNMFMAATENRQCIVARLSDKSVFVYKAKIV